METEQAWWTVGGSTKLGTDRVRRDERSHGYKSHGDRKKPVRSIANFSLPRFAKSNLITGELVLNLKSCSSPRHQLQSFLPLFLADRRSFGCRFRAVHCGSEGSCSCGRESCHTWYIFCNICLPLVTVRICLLQILLLILSWCPLILRLRKSNVVS
jgi:hypothetical protein